MTFNEALQHKGSPFMIPDCSRNLLPELFVQRGYKIGAEIGVYKAQFTEKFCKAGLQMYAIDPWKAYGGAGRTTQSQKRQDFLYGHAQRVLAPYPNCTILRASSMDAVQQFKDGGLDFVYIDGDHSFRYIAEDICEWTPKVRAGGIVAGHDYFQTRSKARNVICHVSTVVKAFLRVRGIRHWYIFNNPQGTEKGERFLSWMFIR